MAVAQPRGSNLAPLFGLIGQGLQQRAKIESQRPGSKTEQILGALGRTAERITGTFANKAIQTAFQDRNKVKFTPELTGDLEKNLGLEAGALGELNGKSAEPLKTLGLINDVAEAQREEEKARKAQAETERQQGIIQEGEAAGTFPAGSSQVAQLEGGIKEVAKQATKPTEPETKRPIGTIGGKVAFVDKAGTITLEETPGGGTLRSLTEPSGTAVEGKLRSEFLRESKQFSEISSAFTRVTAAAEDPSAAGDLALIFNFMKMQDPDSVVRESEFATAQNAGGVDDRTRAFFNRIRSGQRLSAKQRADFVDRSKRLLEAQGKGQTQRDKEFRRLAASQGVSPDNVVIELRPPETIKKKFETFKTKQEADKANLPIGTIIKIGNKFAVVE